MTCPRLVARPLRLVLAWACLLFSGPGLVGAEATRSSFSIPGGDAALTLRQLSRQAAESIVFPIDRVHGVQTHPIAGEFTAREAAERMTAGTGLFVSQDPQTAALLIGRRSAAGPAPPSPPATPLSPMKPRPSIRTLFQAALLAVAAGPASGADANDPIVLSPFEVQTDRDVGYVATSSLAGSRLNTDLRDTPVAISVFTRDFLDDIGRVDVNQAIEYGLNTASEVGFTGNDHNENNFNFRIRGIGSAQRARNYFKTQLNLDVYNTERIDFARGPNAILFGEASPSGMVNSSTKFARLGQDRQSLQLRLGSYYDRRAALDVNRKLGSRLALRANLLWQDANGYREFEYRRKLGLALAGTWRPLPRTQIRLEGESIDIEENRSRPWPGYDAFSSWEAAGRPGAGSPAEWGSPTASGTTRLVGGNGMIVANEGVLGGVPIFMSGAAPNTVASPNQFRVSQGVTNIPGLNQSPQVLDFRRHPRNGNLAGAGARSDSAAQVGGVYLEQQIGENFSFELAGGAEYEKRRWANPINFAAITVRYDANAYLPTFDSAGQQTGIVRNPNFGRQITFGSLTDRNSKMFRVQGRATATYNLDLERLTAGRNRLTRLLGRHRLAGLVSSEEYTDDRRNSNEVNVSPDRLDPNYFAGVNTIQRLSYVDMFSADPSERGHRDPATLPLNRVPLAHRTGLNARGASVTSALVTNGWTSSRNELGTRMFAMQNHLLGGRLVGLFGWRHDDLKTFNSTVVRDPVTQEGTGFIRSGIPSVDASGRTFTRGLVGHVTRWLSLYVNEADNFQVQGASQVFDHVSRASGTVDDRPAIGNKKGEGKDAGLKFNLFDGRLYASLGWYRVADANRFTNVDGNFSNTNGMIEAIWTTINNDVPLYDVLGGDTRSTVSEGYEVEVVANPTRQFRISVNLKRARTQDSELFPNITRYLAVHRDTWLSPQNAGRIVSAGFGSSSGLTVAQVVNNADLLLRTVKAPEGRSPVMDRKITGNFFAKYNFNSGWLRNFAVGGGANYRGPAVLAYRIQTDAGAAFTPAYTDFNALVQYTGRFAGRWRFTLQLNVDNLTDNQDPQAVNGGEPVPGNASQALLPTIDGVVPFYLLPEPRRFSLSATVTF